MELGSTCLKRNGINLLTEAVHPRHGLAWSDGRGIFLSPVKLHSGKVENESSLKLGEFECVQSVHWSSLFELRWCYLCVVHSQSVSIWKVEGETPKLSFKQVRKINASPISRGCLWNPSRDLLCIIAPTQCAFYYNHIQEKGSYAFPPIERGKFMCGAWNKDGTKLVLACGTLLLMYVWKDIDVHITQVQPDSWTVPRLDGHISALVNMTLDQFVLSAELPLDQLCRAESTFIVPDISVTTDRNVRSVSTDDVIRPLNGHLPGHADNLMNLKRDRATAIQGTSQTLVIDIAQKGDKNRVVARGSVKELLSPDLIMFDSKSRCIIVGSNVQCSLQIFRVVEQNVVKIGNIILDKEVRPKGLSIIPRLSQKYCTGCLVLLGRRAESDRTFLPSSQGLLYHLSLHFFALPEIEDSRRRSISRKRDASLQGRQTRPASPGSSNKQKSNIRSASFLKSDYKSRPGVTGAPMWSEAIAEAEKCNNNNDDSPDVQRCKETLDKLVPKIIPKSKSAEAILKSDTVDRKQTKYTSGDDVVDVEQSKQSHRISVRDVNRSYDSWTSDSSSSLYSPRSESNIFTNAGSMNRGESVKRDSSSAALEYSLDDIPPDSVVIQRPGRRPSTLDRDKPKRNSEYADEIITHAEPVPPTRRKKNLVTDLDGAASWSETDTVKVNFSDYEPKFAPPDFTKFDQFGDIYAKNSGGTLKRNSGTRSADSSKCDDDEFKSSKQSEGVSREKLTQFSDDPPGTGGIMDAPIDSAEILLHQQKQIAGLRSRIDQLTQLVEETACVFPSKYCGTKEADVINIEFACADGTVIRKVFLLDDGRLKLDVVQRAFHLDSVELVLGDEAVVIGSNIDGYIPLRFDASSTWKISGSQMRDCS